MKLATMVQNLKDRFSNLQLESDEVHLTPPSGLEYVLYLFEAPQDLLNRSCMGVEDWVPMVAKSSWALED